MFTRSEKWRDAVEARKKEIFRTRVRMPPISEEDARVLIDDFIAQGKATHCEARFVLPTAQGCKEPPGKTNGCHVNGKKVKVGK